jgi:hypothetical protein
MRTLFSIQWLLTTLGMLEAQRAAQEVAQQQDSAPGHGLAAESDPLEPVLQEKICEPHKAKAAKTEE